MELTVSVENDVLQSKFQPVFLWPHSQDPRSEILLRSALEAATLEAN
jgi:hypothetical protein